MEIVRTKAFDRDIRRIGATDGDVEALVAELLANPRAGDVIAGMKGVRKIRFALPSRNIGKRGGGRAIYLAAEIGSVLVLITAYQKNERDDLSQAQRRAILAFLEELER